MEGGAPMTGDREPKVTPTECTISRCVYFYGALQAEL